LRESYERYEAENLKIMTSKQNEINRQTELKQEEIAKRQRVENQNTILWSILIVLFVLGTMLLYVKFKSKFLNFGLFKK
jgi:hypothetical protein